MGIRIGVDATLLDPGRGWSGMSRVLSSMLDELEKGDEANEYRLFSPGGTGRRGNRRWGDVTDASWGGRRRRLWLLTRSPALIRRHRIDVFWGAYHLLPLFRPVRCRFLVTVHDLIFYRHWRTMPWIDSLWVRLPFLRAMHQASLVVTASRWSWSELAAEFPRLRRRLRLIPDSVNLDAFGRLNREEAWKKLGALGIARPFLLAVGVVQPRKNVEGMIEALALLRREGRFQGDLIVAGSLGWGSDRAVRRVAERGLGDSVRFLGFVREPDLACLYAAAEALLFPSFHEGFGIPPLEAMVSGTPVVVSDRCSLPEVVGDAGLYVNPDDPSTIADAVRRILEEPSLREDLVGRGRERVRRFSARGSAEEYRRTFEELAG